MTKYLRNVSKWGIVIAIMAMLQLSSCGDDDGSETPVTQEFDRTELLSSLANNLILPNFESLQTSVTSLSSAAEGFSQNTNEDNLMALRSAWIQAVTDHQHCSAFGFGPASLPLGAYASVLGVFPVDENQVEANVLDPNFNLSASFDRDVRAFYAVEYMIYGNGQSANDLIGAFDQQRLDYLLLLITELKTTVDSIVTEWNASYLTEFSNDNSTSAGSAISLLYNEWVKDYENLKNFKLELPAGLTAGQGSADGTLVEAFYSGISRDLIIEHFESTKNVYLGLSRSGQDIMGFNDYLNSVVGGEELVTTTIPVIEDIDDAISSLPQGRLSDQIEAQEVITLRDLLQANTANFKSSMSSILGISITFNSGDGD